MSRESRKLVPAFRIPDECGARLAAAGDHVPSAPDEFGAAWREDVPHALQRSDLASRGRIPKFHSASIDDRQDAVAIRIEGRDDPISQKQQSVSYLLSDLDARLAGSGVPQPDQCG